MTEGCKQMRGYLEITCLVRERGVLVVLEDWVALVGLGGYFGVVSSGKRIASKERCLWTGRDSRCVAISR